VDIEVTFDSRVTLQSEAVPFLFGNLELLMRFAVKPTGNEHTLHIRTTAPQKDFALTQSADGVTLTRWKAWRSSTWNFRQSRSCVWPTVA